jgi:hypothetical protein
MPPVGICAGGIGQPISLPRPGHVIGFGRATSPNVASFNPVAGPARPDELEMRTALIEIYAAGRVGTSFART